MCLAAIGRASTPAAAGSVATRSPLARPAITSIRSPSGRPSRTCRRTTRPSGVTTYTARSSLRSTTALRGTSRRVASPVTKPTLACMPGASATAVTGRSTRARNVPDCGSAAGKTVTAAEATRSLPT